MTQEEFNNLSPGDVVRRYDLDLDYVVAAAEQAVVATSTLLVTNPKKWALVAKATVPQEEKET